MTNGGQLRKRKRSLAGVVFLGLVWCCQWSAQPEPVVDDKAAETVFSGDAHEAAAELDGELDFAKRHPELVGNRDGALASVRDQANRSLLPKRRAQLEGERDRLKEDLDVDRFHGAFNDKDSDLWYAQRRLEGLNAVEHVVTTHPEAKLLLLDPGSGERGKAAIAIGDPDKAEHIAITVPGVNSSPGQTMAGMVDEAVKLKTESETILRRQGSSDTVATIAWIGYDPPQFNWEGNDPGPGWGDEVKGGYDLSQDVRARAGSESFARFCQGLAAVWQPARRSSAARPQITVLGHSYGSLPVSLALQQLPRGVVTNAVFYGSPGVEETEKGVAELLGLDPGHVFVLESVDDPIRRIPGLVSKLAFGGFPANFPWMVRLSTHEGDGPGDGLRHAQAHGHADYPRTAGDEELYMSGYNMAAVVAGRADLAVLGS